MATTTFSRFDPKPGDLRRMNRVILWSVVVHVAVVAFLLFTPREWWSRAEEERTVMTINLGGAPGPVTSGMTNVGGRTIEQLAPPPPRPEPVRPTPPAPPVETAAPPTRTPPRPAPPVTTAPPRPSPPRSTAKPAETAPRTPSRAPVTGPTVARGNSTVETGATGQGSGLASGGRIAGGEAALADFCCPNYLTSILSVIDSRWNKNHPERGTTVLKFRVHRDGRIDNVEVERPSGYPSLDRAARAALDSLRLPPLPPAYTRETLTVHLSFPYGT